VVEPNAAVTSDETTVIESQGRQSKFRVTVGVEAKLTGNLRTEQCLGS
jgi:hypothetical protein